MKELTVKKFDSMEEMSAWISDKRNGEKLKKKYPEDKYRITGDLFNHKIIVRDRGFTPEFDNIFSEMKQNFPHKTDFDESDVDMLVVGTIGLAKSLNNMRQKDLKKSVGIIYHTLESILFAVYGNKARGVMVNIHNQFLQDHMGIDVKKIINSSEKQMQEVEKGQSKEVNKAYG